MADNNVTFEASIPILRIFDEIKAKEFYKGFLGFTQDWSYGAADNTPLYLQVSRGPIKIHLTEHHGDCCPGARLRIQVKGIQTYHEQLLAKNYKFMRPGLEPTERGTREVLVMDPFGNTIIFWE